MPSRDDNVCSPPEIRQFLELPDENICLVAKSTRVGEADVRFELSLHKHSPEGEAIGTITLPATALTHVWLWLGGPMKHASDLKITLDREMFRRLGI
jgi:hypothetical protein